MFETRMQDLRARLAMADIDVALITDDDNIYYLIGYYDYLHMEFGRPTILVVPRDGEVLLITPTIDLVMAEASARVDRIAPWNDGAGEEWRAELPAILKNVGGVGLEPSHMPPVVRAYLDEVIGRDIQHDIMPVLADMRMIKSGEELQLARHAGEVASTMMAAISRSGS